jgi:hypothetical protein
MAAASAARSNGSSITSPIGAIRITPPQPFELLIGVSMLPITPDCSADRQVLPGARRWRRSATAMSHPS